MRELAPSRTRGARDEERVSIAINADSIATWALVALGEMARQGLPLEIITDDQDFTQEWLREGQVRAVLDGWGVSVVPALLEPGERGAGCHHSGPSRCGQGAFGGRINPHGLHAVLQTKQRVARVLTSRAAIKLIAVAVS